MCHLPVYIVHKEQWLSNTSLHFQLMHNIQCLNVHFDHNVQTNLLFFPSIDLNPEVHSKNHSTY